MKDTVHLIRGKVWAARNSITRPSRADRFKTMFFGTLTVVFLIALLYGSTAFFQKLAAEEPFGSLLVHKLVEFLFLTFFAVMVFSSVVTSLNNFFLDGDLPMLVTAPITHGRVYLARFLQTAVSTGWMVVMFGMPVFIACGYVFQAPWFFYPWIFLVLVAFVITPIALGSLLTMFLVRAFPARKMQDILVILAVVLVVVLYFVFRFIRPEQLFNPDLFYGFAEYFATLRTPKSPLLPSTWGSIAMLSPLDGTLKTDGFFYLLQMLAWGMLIVLVGTVIANRSYLDAYTKSQEGRLLRLTGSNMAQALFNALAPKRDEIRRQFFLKEIRTFFRDTSQWTQLLLLMGLVVVYLFNFKALDLDRFAGITYNLRNTIGYINVVMAGFVMSAICVRFVLPSISLEGKAFWIIRTAPVSLRSFVWGKFFFYIAPVFIVSEMLVIASNIYLGADMYMIVFSSTIMAFLSVAITSLAIGIGAMYPNFEEKNAARMATGISSIIYMSASFLLICTVVGTMAQPMRLLMWHRLGHFNLTGVHYAIIALSVAIVLAIIAAAIFVPINRGIESLNLRED
ncbi:MAG: hypothetical protein H6683_03905 [Deltaproteobacteria bacterium]|nr:hypothetical protein [Deltaproteobacteria bacterium]